MPDPQMLGLSESVDLLKAQQQNLCSDVALQVEASMVQVREELASAMAHTQAASQGSPDLARALQVVTDTLQETTVELRRDLKASSDQANRALEEASRAQAVAKELRAELQHETSLLRDELRRFDLGSVSLPRWQRNQSPLREAPRGITQAGSCSSPALVPVAAAPTPSAPSASPPAAPLQAPPSPGLGLMSPHSGHRWTMPTPGKDPGGVVKPSISPRTSLGNIMSVVPVPVPAPPGGGTAAPAAQQLHSSPSLDLNPSKVKASPRLAVFRSELGTRSVASCLEFSRSNVPSALPVATSPEDAVRSPPSGPIRAASPRHSGSYQMRTPKLRPGNR